MKTHRAAWWLTLSAVVIGLDQWTKHLIVQHFFPYIPYPVLPFLNITLSFNQGASFGMLRDAGGWQVWLFAAIAVIVVAVIFWWLIRMKNGDHWLACALSLIIGGALGNLIDRVRLGYVVDFVDFHVGTWHFAIFNVADATISIGAVLLLLNLLFSKHKTNEQNHAG